MSTYISYNIEDESHIITIEKYVKINIDIDVHRLNMLKLNVNMFMVF